MGDYAGWVWRRGYYGRWRHLVATPPSREVGPRGAEAAACGVWVWGDQGDEPARRRCPRCCAAAGIEPDPAPQPVTVHRGQVYVVASNPTRHVRVEGVDTMRAEVIGVESGVRRRILLGAFHQDPGRSTGYRLVTGDGPS